ncbi:MAG TPA: hypothetical protein VGO92_15355 [Acidimicrobiales bacterium]|nr:hypothetical protein [Acidimicrobiales bacterium]
MSDDPALDPVLARRAQVARLVAVGMRAGYALLALAIAVFLWGAVGHFTPRLTLAFGLCMAGCTLTLAPSIVFSYAVRAAEREDREQGR